VYTEVLHDLIPIRIVFLCYFSFVIGTVHLDCQIRFRTVKIKYESNDWMLPAKFISKQLSVPQTHPQYGFGFGGIFP